MIRNTAAAMMALVLTAVTGMTALHWLEIQKAEKRMSTADTLARRAETASGMLTELEKYRRLSGSFRKLGEGEEAQIKARLKESSSNSVAALDSLNPTAEERALASKAGEQLAEFFVLSAKLEPMLFTRDVYLKPQAKELHDAITASWTRLAAIARDRANENRSSIVSSTTTSLRVMAGAGVAILLLVLLLQIRSRILYSKPLERLALRAKAAEKSPIAAFGHDGGHNGGREESARPLRGKFGEIESTIQGLARTVQAQRDERHHFITAVATDLRSPLMMLQAATDLLAIGDKLDPAQRSQAVEITHRSMFRLSRTLDDLTDVVDLEKSTIRLDEKIVDLRSILRDVSLAMGGAQGALHQLTVCAPTVPVWTHLDPQRFERVLVNLTSKMMNLLPQGGRIELSLSQSSDPLFKGLEIVVHEGANRNVRGLRNATGPEQDLLRHWVSENGFGMALAHKIIKAHGGSITASGVAGTGVLFVIRIPQERVAMGLISAQMAANRAIDNETAWLRTAISPV